MKHTFKPLHFNDRMSWFFTLPFYTLKNFIDQQPLEFDTSEILDIAHVEKNGRTNYLVQFNTKDMTGVFNISQIPVSATNLSCLRKIDQKQMLVEISKRLRGNFIKQLTQFYKRSAVLSYFFALIIAALCLPFLSTALQNILASFAAPVCTERCVSVISLAYMKLGFTFFAFILAPLFFSWLFYFVLSKGHRDINLQQSMKTEAFMLAFMAVYLTFTMSQTSKDQELYTQINKAHQMLIGKIPFKEKAGINPLLDTPSRRTSSEESN